MSTESRQVRKNIEKLKVGQDYPDDKGPLTAQRRFFNGLMFSAGYYDFKDKDTALYNEYNYVLNILSEVFKFEGLPETIPDKIMFMMTVSNGYTFVTNKANGKDAYVYRCILSSGEQVPCDPYYIPKRVIITNPYQGENGYFANLDREKDGVLLKADPLMQGIIPIISKYNTSIVEADLTINMLNILTRASALATAGDDNVKDAIDEFFKNLEDGEYASIVDGTFDDENGIKVQPLNQASANSAITQAIEYKNYCDAKRWNVLGINANFNMKRESINESEAGLNDMALLPYIDLMLSTWQENIKKLNEYFGWNATVKLNSSWLLEHAQSQLHAEEDGIEVDEINEEALEGEPKNEEEAKEETKENEETEKELNEELETEEEVDKEEKEEGGDDDE